MADLINPLDGQGHQLGQFCENDNDSDPNAIDFYENYDAFAPDSHIDTSQFPHPLPPPPEDVDRKDPLQLGIHYHDINHMALSAHYLSLSARQGHAVGMYLYGMALRHGWGCKVDMVEAVRLFDRAAGIVLQSLPRLAIEGGGVGGVGVARDGGELMLGEPTPSPTQTIQDSDHLQVRGYSLDRRMSQASSASTLSLADDGPESPLTGNDYGSLPYSPNGGTPTSGQSARWRRFSFPSLGFGSLRRGSGTPPTYNDSPPPTPTPLTEKLNLESTFRRQNFTVARSFLPLPLYEVGICYHQGWGVPTSKSTALYYFQLAAQLGDADAQAQVGYLYLQGGNGVKRDKKRAARWLREAVKGGKRIVGEQWIWKEKWSEEGFGGVSKRRKLKRGYRQKDQ